MSHVHLTHCARAATLAALVVFVAACGEPCSEGLTRCDGVCVDTLVATAHCGACGQDCGMGSCDAGACLCDTGGGATECSGDWPRCVDLDTSDADCGSCSVACVTDTGADCVSGACVCPGGTFRCGAAEVSCCQGSDCCGDVCQTRHSNGLGQSFFTCDPLRTYTLASATLAADAWNPSVDKIALFCGTGDGAIGRQFTGVGPNFCAVWVYEGPDAGTVTLNTIDAGCHCPPWQTQHTWD